MFVCVLYIVYFCEFYSAMELRVKMLESCKDGTIKGCDQISARAAECVLAYKVYVFFAECLELNYRSIAIKVLKVFGLSSNFLYFLSKI